jgi:hypothetical protein
MTAEQIFSNASAFAHTSNRTLVLCGMGKTLRTSTGPASARNAALRAATASFDSTVTNKAIFSAGFKDDERFAIELAVASLQLLTA